ncbi:MAG: hypothetical protein ACLQUZ_18500 [Rhizomicrobium sp.]
MRDASRLRTYITIFASAGLAIPLFLSALYEAAIYANLDWSVDKWRLYASVILWPSAIFWAVTLDGQTNWQVQCEMWVFAAILNVVLYSLLGVLPWAVMRVVRRGTVA